LKSYQIGLYEKSMPENLSLPEKLKETGTACFDYLELSIDETDEKLSRLEWGSGDVKDLYLAMEESGVFIKSICLSGHRRFPLGDPDPEIRQRGIIIMEQAITLAARLGVRLIQIAGYDVYYKPSTAETQILFAENLERSVLMAAREGITLAFETMETPFINTVTKAVAWVRKCCSPYLQVYPDTGNITNAALEYGGKIKEDLENGAGYLAALHLKESKPGIYREVPYGEGHVDFSEVIQIAWHLGIRLYVAEFWYSGAAGSWRETLRGNNRFLRNFLDKAGNI
jgi:predicted hexulose-6-phosphate isomerase